MWRFAKSLIGVKASEEEQPAEPEQPKQAAQNDDSEFKDVDSERESEFQDAQDVAAARMDAAAAASRNKEAKAAEEREKARKALEEAEMRKEEKKAKKALDDKLKAEAAKKRAAEKRKGRKSIEEKSPGKASFDETSPTHSSGATSPGNGRKAGGEAAGNAEVKAKLDFQAPQKKHAEDEERAKKEAESKRKAAEEKAKKDAEAKRKAAEEEERARKEAESKKKAAEEKAKKDAEAKRKAAEEEERARKEAESKKKAAEEKAKKDAEAKRKAAEEEERARQEAESRRKAAEEEEQAKRDAEAKKKAAEEEEQEKKEAEAKRKAAEKEEKAKRDAEAKGKAAEEKKAKKEAESRRKAAAEEEKAKREAEEKRKAAAEEEQAKKEAESKRKAAEDEERAKREAEEKRKAAAEGKPAKKKAESKKKAAADEERAKRAAEEKRKAAEEEEKAKKEAESKRKAAEDEAEAKRQSAEAAKQAQNTGDDARGEGKKDAAGANEKASSERGAADAAEQAAEVGAAEAQVQSTSAELALRTPTGLEIVLAAEPPLCLGMPPYDPNNPLGHQQGQAENKPGHKCFPEYSLPAWCAHPLKPVAATGTSVIFPGVPHLCAGTHAGIPGVQDMLELAAEAFDCDVEEMMGGGSGGAMSTAGRGLAVAYVANCVAYEALSRDHPDVAMQPQCIAGFSIGEYAALVAAGVLDYDQGLMLVKAYAEAIEDLSKTYDVEAICVAGLRLERVEALCSAAAEGDEALGPGKPQAYVSHFLAPCVFVCTGRTSTVRLLWRLVQDVGGAEVSTLMCHAHAAHTPMAAPVVEDVAAVLDSIPLRPPRCDLYLNLGVRVAAGTSPDVIARSLREQIVSPVRWDGVVSDCLRRGVRRFFECGPGGNLRSLVPLYKGVCAGANSSEFISL